MADTTAPTIPARPTTYNGVKMRSRLEASYAAWADQVGVTWKYEPQCFASAGGQYLPDFRLEGVMVAEPGKEPSKRTVYVEVKPTLEIAQRQSPWVEKAEIIWQSEPEAVFVLDAADEDVVHVFTQRWRSGGHAVWVVLGRDVALGFCLIRHAQGLHGR